MMTEKTLNDLKKVVDQDIEKIFGKSKKLEKIIKIRRSCNLITTENLRQQKEKQRIEINNKLEDERLMLKAENMQSMVSVIDTVASSPNIPAKVKGEQFLEYWRTQMEKDPHIREMFEIMSEEEIRQMQGIPNPEDDGNAMPPPDEAPQEVQTVPVKGEQQQEQVEVPQQQVQQQVPQQNMSKQEEVIRNSFQ